MPKGTGGRGAAGGQRDRGAVQDMFSGSDYAGSYTKEGQAHYDHGKKVMDQDSEFGNAVNTYTEMYYEPINAYLRGLIDRPTFGGVEEELTQNRRAIKGLDKMFKSKDATFQRNARLYRGAGEGSPIYEALKAGNLRAGDVFRDKGFMSTSVNPNIAAAGDFSGVFNGRRVVMRIRAKKGKRGLHIAAKSDIPTERETLLPRGSRVKVRGIKEGTIGTRGAYFVDVDLM